MDIPRPVGPEGVVLISDEYRELNRLAHEDPKYGTSAPRNAPMLQEVLDRAEAATLLDYGCGKRTLEGAVQSVLYRGYDPALPGLDAAPEPADVVYCGDVMEHVEPDFEGTVLDHVLSLARVAAVFVISCAPGNRTLADGSPAHRNVQTPEYWRARLAGYGELEEHPGLASKPEIRVIVWKKSAPSCATLGPYPEASDGL